MTNLVKNAIFGFYKFSGAMRLQEVLTTPFRYPFMSVLLFHRVTDAIPEDSLTISTRRFRQICEMLRRQFNVVPLAEVFRIQQTKTLVPPRTVAITFDDCYLDNLFAARVLSEFNLPASFFVPTAFVGTDHVFEWDIDLPRMPNLTWDNVREMASLGFDIGSHCATHPNLATVTEEQMWQELLESKGVIEEELGVAPRWLAYPFGTKNCFRLERLPLVMKAGYEGCLSGHGRFVVPRWNEPIMPRIPVPDFHSLVHLELFLTGSLQWFYSLKKHAELAEQDSERKIPLILDSAIK